MPSFHFQIEEHSFNSALSYDGFSITRDEVVWFTLEFISGGEYAVLRNVTIVSGDCPVTEGMYFPYQCGGRGDLSRAFTAYGRGRIDKWTHYITGDDVC